MTEAQRAPSEELHHGPVTVPRVAATVILLRGGNELLEVLLVRRTPRARFMGGAWVFPGGGVNPGDGEGPAGIRAAGIRELHEEAGVELAPDAELIPFSRWITPARVKIRYDTWFFLATMPEGQVPRVDDAEIVDHRWFTPQGALEAARHDEIALVFPTIKHLEKLAAFPSAAEVLGHARGGTVTPVQPRILDQAGALARIVLPGEPGYADD